MKADLTISKPNVNNTLEDRIYELKMKMKTSLATKQIILIDLPSMVSNFVTKNTQPVWTKVVSLA